MASLRNSPYFPLEVDAFVSDEKLNECSASANGVYIRILCLMHKSESYGRIAYRSTKAGDDIERLTEKLRKHLPYSDAEIRLGLSELIDAGVLYIEGSALCQKRMIKDGELSEKRSHIGKLGMARRWAGNRQDGAASEQPPKAEAQKRYTAREFKADLIALGIKSQTADDWMANRKSKKLPPTKTAFEETKAELLKDSRYTPEEQLKMAAIKGWGGYKHKWFIKELAESNGNYNNNSGGSESAQESQPRNYEESF